MTQAEWLRRGTRRKTEDDEEDVKTRPSAALSAYVSDQVGLVASATLLARLLRSGNIRVHTNGL